MKEKTKVDRLENFTLEWATHGKTIPRHYTEWVFSKSTGFDLSSISGRLFLDGGCGSGRFSELLAERGAEIVAVDASRSVEETQRQLKRFPNVHVVQSALEALPFRDETFDMSFSLGVLHHTETPEVSFKELARCLKEKGELAVSVYSREGIRRKVADQIGSIYRTLASKVQPTTLYRICEKIIATTPIPMALASNPYAPPKFKPTLVVNLLFPFLSTLPNKEWRLLDTFDYLSPTFQSKHTYSEVFGWFRRSGLEPTAMKIPISVRGMKR